VRVLWGPMGLGEGQILCVDLLLSVSVLSAGSDFLISLQSLYSCPLPPSLSASPASLLFHCSRFLSLSFSVPILLSSCLSICRSCICVMSVCMGLSVCSRRLHILLSVCPRFFCLHICRCVVILQLPDCQLFLWLFVCVKCLLLVIFLLPVLKR